jgi:copper transport protein
MADLRITPARPGLVMIAIDLADAQSRPLAVQAVEIVLSDPQGRTEPIRREARRQGAGWQIDAVGIPTAGPWLLRLDLLVSDFDRISLSTHLDLATP